MDRDVEVVLSLSSRILEELQPEEVPLVDALGRDFLNARPRGGDGALGFGEAEVSWFVTVLPVAAVVGDVLLDVAKSAATDTLKDGAKGVLRRLRSRRGERVEAPPGDVPITLELRQHVRDRARQHALAIGLDAARADLLADAVVASLSEPTASP